MEAGKSITISSCLHFSRVFGFFLALLLLLSNVQTASAATASTNQTYSTTSSVYKNYIITACNSTEYSDVCYKCLSPYSSAIKSDPQKLCYAALNVTMKYARNTHLLLSLVSKGKGLSTADKAVIKDCRDNVDDLIDRLKQSMKEMASLGDSESKWHMDNIRTWMSAAVTDEGTCSDDFQDQQVSSWLKKKVSASVVKVDKMACVCLALLNNITY